MNMNQLFSMQQEQHSIKYVTTKVNHQQSSSTAAAEGRKSAGCCEHINANKLCYFCGSTKHASSDCPMYA